MVTLSKKYPNVVCIFNKQNHGGGAARNIGIAESTGDLIYCLDSDNFYLCDVINKWKGDNCVFTIHDTTQNPIYSYIELNHDNLITNIKEKVKIIENPEEVLEQIKRLLKSRNIRLKKKIARNSEG
jgi:glycosyltransferase involved in cell wall biosynthesis